MKLLNATHLDGKEGTTTVECTQKVVFSNVGRTPFGQTICRCAIKTIITVRCDPDRTSKSAKSYGISLNRVQKYKGVGNLELFRFVRYIEIFTGIRYIVELTEIRYIGVSTESRYIGNLKKT